MRMKWRASKWNPNDLNLDNHQFIDIIVHRLYALMVINLLLLCMSCVLIWVAEAEILFRITMRFNFNFTAAYVARKSFGVQAFYRSIIEIMYRNQYFKHLKDWRQELGRLQVFRCFYEKLDKDRRFVWIDLILNVKIIWSWA